MALEARVEGPRTACPTMPGPCALPTGRVAVEDRDVDQGTVIRPVTADDADALAALFDGLAADDRQRRFFQQYRPPRGFVERVATVAARGGAGFVAVAIDGDGKERELLGEAGFVPLADGNGELAITVTPAARGWLGPYLLDAVSEAAAARGVPNLEVDVLTTDRTMLGMLSGRGSVSMEHTGWQVVRLLIATWGDTPTWTGPHDGPRILVEAPSGRWWGEEQARAAGLQVLTCSGSAAAPCPALAGERCALAEGADAIVVAHPRPDEHWQRLLESHARVHPGVPVWLEQPLIEGPHCCAPPTCSILDASGVVALVERLATESP